MNTKKLISPLLLTLTLSACTNLSSVKQYSETANNSLAQVPTVFNDFSGSCERRADYAPINYKPDCSNLKDTEKPLKEIVSVLQTYIKSLGVLADDQKVTFSKDIDSLENELKGLEKLDSDQVAAVSTVAKYLSKLASDGYRRNVVKTTLHENDIQVKTITTALSNIIQQDYEELLELEKRAAIKYYRGIQAKYGKTEPLAVMIKMEQQQEKLSEIQKRVKAIKPLTQLLDQVQQGHHQLTVQSDKLDSKEVIELVKTFVKDSNPVIKLIKDTYQ